MTDFNIDILNDIDEFHQDCINGFKKVKRWDYKEEEKLTECENDLEHIYKSILLAIKIVNIIEKYSDTPIDKALIYEAVAGHDLGEILKGDTLNKNKTLEGEKEEYECFKKTISILPKELAECFEKSYHLQHANKENFSETADKLRKTHPVEADIFEAIEKYGYVLFVYGSYKRGYSKDVLVTILMNHHQELKELAEKLPIFKKFFYNEEIQKAIEEFIEPYKGVLPSKY